MSEPLANGGAPVAEAPQVVVPTTENVLDQASAGAASLTGTPALENPSLGGVSSVLASGNMSETAGPGAIAEKKANEVAAAAANPNKKGGLLGFLGKLNPIQKTYEDPNAPKATAVAAKTEVSPGLGFAPGEPKVAKIEVPPALAGGSTPPVPGVTPEAQAAEASANKVLGGNSQLPDAPSTGTPGSLDAAMDEIHKTAEEAWNKTESTPAAIEQPAMTTPEISSPSTADPATATESLNLNVEPAPGPAQEFPGTSAQPPSNELVAPPISTAIDASTVDSTVTPIEAAKAVSDPVADAAAHPEIVDYDRNAAATAGAAEDAANAAKNEAPNLDPLSVTGSEESAPPYTPPVDGLLSADVTASALPEAQAPTPDPLAVEQPLEMPAAPAAAAPDVLTQAADIAANAEATGDALPADGATAPAIENPTLAQANEVVANAEATSGSLSETSTAGTITGSQEPTAPTDVLTQAADIAANAEATGDALPADGATAPAIENPTLAQANEVVANATADTTGNTPIEAIATPLPDANPSNENQWSASNLTGAIAPAENSATVTDPAIPNEAAPTNVVQSQEIAPQITPTQITAPDGNVLPAIPDIAAPAEPAIPAAVTTSETSPSVTTDASTADVAEENSNITPFPAATLETQSVTTQPEIAADLNTTTTIGTDAVAETTPTATALPDNMSALPGVTPEVQSTAQINAATSGAAPSLVGTEAPAATADNISAFPGATAEIQTPEQVAAAISGAPLSTVGSETIPTTPVEDPNTGTPTAPPIAA